MAFTLNMSGTTEVDDSIVKAFDKQFLIAAGQEEVMDQLATYKTQIGAESIKFQKYARLPIDTTPLSQYDDKDSVAMADTPILLTPKEYGEVVTTTQLANLQSGGVVDQAAAMLVGMNMGQTRDTLAVQAVEASANLNLPNGVAAEAALTAGDVMTTTFLNKLYNRLSRKSIQAHQAVAGSGMGKYVMIIHEDVAHDLRSSAGAGSWVDIGKYSNPSMIFNNEIGTLSGFRILVDNHLTINVDGGDALVDTYKSICMGFNAFGKAVSLPEQMVATGPFDKLARFVNLGWKAALHYEIVDADAIEVGICASSVGNNLA